MTSRHRTHADLGWQLGRGLFRKQRRIAPHEIAMLCVIAATVVLYFAGAFS